MRAWWSINETTFAKLVTMKLSSKIWIVRSFSWQTLLFFREMLISTFLFLQKLLESDSHHFHSRLIDSLNIDWTLRKTFFFFFFLKFFFWRFWLSSMIETTHCKLSIFLTWKQSKAKSIAKDSKQKKLFFFFSFFSISITSTKNLFNNKKFELFVSQRFETLLSVTILTFRNFFFFFWTISYFFEFKKAEDDHTKKIKKFNSKIEKIRTSKLSIDESTEKQTDEHEIKTISFSISNFFFFTKKNDADDWFSFAKFSKSRRENRRRNKLRHKQQRKNQDRITKFTIKMNVLEHRKLSEETDDTHEFFSQVFFILKLWNFFSIFFF
jgi:hypothetical protein